MSKINTCLSLWLAVAATACVMEEEPGENEEELDESTAEQAVTCYQTPPAAEVTKAATTPGVSAIAPSTAYWTTGDGAFTMGVTGLQNFTSHTMWGRAQLQTGVPTSKGICEATMISVNLWGKSASTGCWILLGGATKAGVWTPSVAFPPSASGTCLVRADAPNISGLAYSQARVATVAYRNIPFPASSTLPLQVTSILVVD